MRVTTAREQYEMIQPWYRTAGPRWRAPAIPSKGLDALGITQRKLNNNTMSWAEQLTPQDLHEGGIWYPTGNEWGQHMADLHGRHPDKVYGGMAKASPQREWYDNLDDAASFAQLHGRGEIPKFGGISATDNFKQTHRVFDAADDPQAIHEAFLGTKNVTRGGQKVPILRSHKDIPKTHDFFDALRDPEMGGAYNHLNQPAVIDSWQGRAALWPKDKWDEAMAGGKPLTWPGKGTGQGLDKPLPVKEKQPDGSWVHNGKFKKAGPRDVAARVTGLAGGYYRMRQAVQHAAFQHDVPYSHAMQAAIWGKISGNGNPNTPGFDESKTSPNGQLWNQMWRQRANSGLHVPEPGAGPGGLHLPPGMTASRRTAAHGAAFDPEGPENTVDPGWGGPSDISAILRHMQMAPPGWDHWNDQPGLIRLGPDGHDQEYSRHAMVSRYDRELLAYAQDVIDARV